MDRNGSFAAYPPVRSASLSARRAWIEIPAGCWRESRRAVALRKESVDRNCEGVFILRKITVALRKESVDRNDVIRPAIDVFLASLSARRAWIEICRPCCSGWLLVSLSARRAWIEIAQGWRISGSALVALRKESVDRNQGVHYDNYNLHWVALRKESVDRNSCWLLARISACLSLSARRAWIEIAQGWRVPGSALCRSPQGERG